MEDDSVDGGIDQRLERLEQRIADLERGHEAPREAPVEDVGDFWALNELQRRMPEGGAVLFAGDVTLDSNQHWSWQEGVDTSSLLQGDWGTASAALSALHHPVRLTLLQAVLQGTTTVSELTTLEGLGTTGQVYHHVRALVAAGWLVTLRRGQYSVPGQRVVPLLVIVAAARG